MPLYSKISSSNGWGGIWKVTESYEDLYSMLDDSNGLHLNNLGKISSKKRQLEYIAVRVLLQYLIKGPTNIQYLSSGKPYLLNLKTNISISHTHGYVAILLSDTHVPGIDIEKNNQRVLKLKSRIVGPNECARSSEEILLHWCAKETAFKILDRKGVDFINNFVVKNLYCSKMVKESSNETFTLSYYFDNDNKGDLTMFYSVHKDFILTYSFA